MPIPVCKIIILRFGFLLLLWGCCLQPVHAQQHDFQPEGILYKDNYVTVELEYKIVLCSPNKSCRFRYRIIGQPRGQDFFVNWKMSFYDCDGGLTTLTNHLNIGRFTPEDQGTLLDDLDWTFQATRLYHSFYDVQGSYYPDNSRPIRGPLPISTKASSISGALSIDYGEPVTLKQQGGTLGENAKWYWYTGSCGGDPVGEGESITITPVQSTRYFVRAEGANGTTDCISARVTVNTKSSAADYIDGKAVLCKGEGSTKLEVTGGKTGKAARWCWYRDSCAGRPIGYGKQLTVSPQTTTTYFVRAEGADNITESRSLTVSIVDEQSRKASGIDGPPEICEGTPLPLKITGGKLAADAQWCWYRDNLSAGNLVGKGEMITDRPSRNTMYYVRAEGICNTTEAQSANIKVIESARAPSGIVASAWTLFRGQQLKLTVNSVSPGANSQWVWYKKSCTPRHQIDTGAVIRVRAHRTTSYFVRAENSCSKSAAAQQTIIVKRRFVFINVGLIASFGTPSGGPSDVAKTGVNQALTDQSLAFTIGKVKHSGWYFRGKYTLNTKKPTYTTNDYSVTDFSSSTTYYKYNGQIQNSRLSGTAGLIFSLTKNSLLMNLGAGYGERNLSWGITEYSYQTGTAVRNDWAKHSVYSVKGVEAELGLMIHLPVFNIMLGGNAIFPVSGNNSTSSQSGKQYIDAYAGVGFNF